MSTTKKVQVVTGKGLTKADAKLVAGPIENPEEPKVVKDKESGSFTTVMYKDPPKKSKLCF